MRILHAAVGAAIVLGVLTGCARPLIPASVENPGRTQAPPGKPLAEPAKPVLGVDLYAKYNYPLSKVNTYGRRDLRYIKKVLHSDRVSISWNLFAPFNHSDQVVAARKATVTGSSRTGGVQGGSTLTPANVALLTRIAIADGMMVQYRPLIKIEGPSQWEGYVAPANIATWFRSYFRAMLPYLRVAQRYRIAEFVVGTELADLEQYAPASQWRAFLSQVSDVYHGRISYAAWGGHYYKTSARKLPRVADMGLTTYPDIHFRSVNCPAIPTVWQLVGAWRSVFKQVPAKLRARTSIDELGIPAGCGAWNAPWNWNKGYVPNQQVQARWFTAACIVVKQLDMRAIYFWNVNLANDPYHPPPKSLPSFEGKLGARAIAHCPAILAAAPKRR